MFLQNSEKQTSFNWIMTHFGLICKRFKEKVLQKSVHIEINMKTSFYSQKDIKMFSHPEDEGVEQQQRLQTEDHRFGFHPPRRHNPTGSRMKCLFTSLSLSEHSNTQNTATGNNPVYLCSNDEFLTQKLTQKQNSSHMFELIRNMFKCSI